MLNVRVFNTVCHGPLWVCVMYVSAWYVPARPGTSLGSPASVMTEDPWLGVTSCGSPGSEMCHQQRRPTGASPPVGCFSCVQQAADWVGGWMPFPESQGRVTGTLSPSDSWCAARRSLKPHRCPLLSVLGLAGTAWSLSISFSLHVYVCAFTGPKAHPSSTPLWPSPSAWFPHTLSKPFNGF